MFIPHCILIFQISESSYNYNREHLNFKAVRCLLSILFVMQRESNSSMLLLLLNRFSRVRPCATHRQQPTRLPHPWDSPGKNTGVGCHFLLQCLKVKSESEVAQSCPTLSNPMDCGPPGSSVHGIFQARVLEWGAIWPNVDPFWNMLYSFFNKYVSNIGSGSKNNNNK